MKHKLHFILFMTVWAGSLFTPLAGQINIQEILQQAETQQLADQVYPVQFEFVATHFLGAPYVEQTLEINDTEALVINTDGFDCVTLIENIYALTQLIQEHASADQFAAHLQENRYYEGEIDGYESRIHYFSAWLQSGAQRRKLASVTREIGQKYDKTINFISTHLDKYPKVTRPEMIRTREGELNAEPVWYLPKSRIDAYPKVAQSGDILAITTSIGGLDVVHTGFAWVSKDQVDLFHASSKQGKVMRSPLAKYLNTYKYMTGIIVYRPVH